MIAQVLAAVGLASDPLEATGHDERRANLVARRAELEAAAQKKIVSHHQQIAKHRDQLTADLAAADAKAEAARRAQNDLIINELHASLIATLRVYQSSPTRAGALAFAAAYISACDRATAELGGPLSKTHLVVPFHTLAIEKNPAAVTRAAKGWSNDQHGVNAGHVEALHQACERMHAIEISAALDAVDVAVSAGARAERNPPTEHAKARFACLAGHCLASDAASAIAELEASETDEAARKLPGHPQVSSRAGTKVLVNKTNGSLETFQ